MLNDYLNIQYINMKLFVTRKHNFAGSFAFIVV